MELIARLELATSSLPRKCSTSEPYEHRAANKQNNTKPTESLRANALVTTITRLQLPVIQNGAGNGTRTRDPQLGRLML